MRVIATDKFEKTHQRLRETGETPHRGDLLELSEERARLLIDKGYADAEQAITAQDVINIYKMLMEINENIEELRADLKKPSRKKKSNDSEGSKK